MSDRGKSNVLVVRGQRAGISRAADKAVVLRKRFLTRQHWFPSRSWSECGLERKLARTCSALIQACHCLPPASRSHYSLGIAERHLNELLGLSKGRNGDLGANRGSSTERRR